jgi:CheY-like chemotaxis protein
VASILCIDDQPAGLAIRKQLLESKGYEVFTATDGPRAVTLVRERPVDLVILDYRMPGMDGEEVAAILKAETPHRPIVLLTGYSGKIPERLIAMVDACVEKGNSASVLLNAVEKALDNSRRRPARHARAERNRERA